MNNKTPTSLIPHIGIFGKTNAGKSSLMNSLVNQSVAIVSSEKGTTTDPVYKRMELIPVGPVVFIDTAGLNDDTALGELRKEKTISALKSTDISLLISSSIEIDHNFIEQKISEFKSMNIPYLLIFTKLDLISNSELKLIKANYENALFVDSISSTGINELKEKLVCLISVKEEKMLIGDVIQSGSHVVLVIPIDSEAPKGRIILPQVQIIRDCLDNGIITTIVTEGELKKVIDTNDNIDLVITDSQAFKNVSNIVPENIKLTSFSIIFARFKGDLSEFVDGAMSIDKITRDSKILIAEACSHNVSHEDIGQVKIPKLLEERLGFLPNITHKMGKDFARDVKGFDLVIHCGSCMLNSATLLSRINDAKLAGVPITNYGITIAYINGILERTIEVFKKRP